MSGHNPETRAGGPSRLFILRPVATSLFMLAILLAGIGGERKDPIGCRSRRCRKWITRLSA